MGNDICPPEGPKVKGWVILKDGDERFDSDMNDNKPYYYHTMYKDKWRRNIMGWGPPILDPHNGKIIK